MIGAQLCPCSGCRWGSCETLAELISSGAGANTALSRASYILIYARNWQGRERTCLGQFGEPPLLDPIGHRPFLWLLRLSSRPKQGNTIGMIPASTLFCNAEPYHSTFKNDFSRYQNPTQRKKSTRDALHKAYTLGADLTCYPIAK